MDNAVHQVGPVVGARGGGAAGDWLEAMVGAAAAATGRGVRPVAEDVEFLKPAAGDGTTLRVTVAGPSTLAASIRDETGGECVRARLVYSDFAVPQGPLRAGDEELSPIPNLERMYGGWIWRYLRVTARHVEAELDGAGRSGPGLRDGLVQGLGVCVPGASLTPLGIDRLISARPAGASLRFSAAERSCDGDVHTFDAVMRAGGEVVERWEGLRVRAAGDVRGTRWSAALLGPHLQRRLAELTGVRAAIALEPHAGAAGRRRAGTALAASRAVGRPVVLRYRLDGRPELGDGRALSASHGPGATLCVVADGPVGCDVEQVAARTPEAWRGLLGRHFRLAELTAEGGPGEGPEPADTAATRVWSAIECLRKAGQPADAPLTPLPRRDDWTVFASGTLRIATLAATLRGVSEPVVFAVLVDGYRSRTA